MTRRIKKGISVEIYRACTVEKVRAYTDGEDNLVQFDNNSITDAYKCPTCKDIYLKAEEAADCCGSWKKVHGTEKEE